MVQLCSRITAGWLWYASCTAQDPWRSEREIEDLAANRTNEDVKAAGREWLDTYAVGATNSAATEKLVAALEACGCETQG